MIDKELVKEILSQVYHSTQVILKRFEPIKSPDDFIDTDYGFEKLDAICMQLIAIGESLKNLDKVTNKSLLKKYPEIDWKKVKGMRDIITHHYFDLDSEVVFDVCDNHIQELASTINRIIKALESKDQAAGCSTLPPEAFNRGPWRLLGGPSLSAGCRYFSKR